VEPTDKNSPSHPRAGQLQAVLSALGFATGGYLTKRFESAGGAAMTLIAFRMLAGLAVFGGVAAARGYRLPSRKLVAIGLGLGGVQLVSNSALIVGFAKAPASLVVLVFYVYPLLVVAGGALLFGEGVGRNRAVLIAAGLTGLVLAVGTPASVTVVGVTLGLSAGIGMASFILGSRYAFEQGMQVIQLLALSYACPSVLMVALLATGVVPLPSLTTDAIAPMIGFIALGSVIPVVLFVSAIRRIGAGMTALLATIEPFAAVVLAYLLLDESLTALQLVGGALIITAAALLSVLPAGAGVSRRGSGSSRARARRA
jgi:drug/metabolite transporter (DMT)-like permease